MKLLYGKKHLNITFWGYAYRDFIKNCNFNGSIHDNGISPYEKWFNRKPDMLKFPMLPFGSIVMAHIPLALQSAGSQRSEVTYCVGTSLDHKKGLRLYNPRTKKEIIRGTFKTIGPQHISKESINYEINVDDSILELPSTEPEILSDVNDYKCLIGTEHVDPEDAILYRTTEVVVEESDPEIGPQIVAYRRRVKPNGTLYPLNADDDWPYIIDIIVEYTANYI